MEHQLARAWPPAEWSSVTVVLAVSGGADSIALARACLATRLSGPGRLLVAHFNHRLRGEESDQDAEFVAAFCRQWSLPFLLGSSSVGVAQTDEESARAARYSFFESLARDHGARFVVTAHTADDQAETILHRIVRGTSLAGLRGILRSREMFPGVALSRPLLECSRADVLQYLQDLGQPFRHDRSNDDRRFTRNRLRHEFLPWLQREINPEVATALIRLGRIAADAQESLDAEVDRLTSLAVDRSLPGQVRVACEPLRNVSSHLVRQLFVLLWKSQGWGARHMSQDHWNRLAELTRAPPIASSRVHFPGAIEARRESSWLVLGPLDKMNGPDV